MSNPDATGRSPADRTAAARRDGAGRRSTAISDRHLSKLAIVYVRQSSTQQIFDHQESRERQYALADYAATLGWPRERIVVIDEDQGRSGRTVEQRPGFQRLLAEVTLDHVGMVLGLEISRLSRSSKDWYHLLEVCAVFGTLLADQDGIYDANDSNDRLVLGLKGTMSEVELTTMRNRLERGKLHKAERGELILTVPCGYLKLPHGEVILDPDEQVRATVQLVFAKFAELGSFGKVYRYLRQNKICVGCRVHQGPRRGELVWRPVSRALLGRMLHHPIYAGAYSYGRRRVDPKRTAASGGKVRMQYVPMAEWKVLQRDRFPAYITWERYLANQQRLLENRSWPDAPGVPRVGAALLPGLLVCGACGRRMHAGYRTKAKPYYECMRRKLEGSTCCGLGAAAIDDLVGQQVLRALEPAALELSLQAHAACSRRTGTPPPALAPASGAGGPGGPACRAAVSGGRARESSGGPQPGATLGRGVADATCFPGRLRSLSARAAATTPAKTKGPGSWLWPATFRRSGILPRRPLPSARRSSAFWWSVSWSTSGPTVNEPSVEIAWRGGLTTTHKRRSLGLALSNA